MKGFKIFSWGTPPLVTASFIYPLQSLNVLNIIIFFFVIKVVDCVYLLLPGLPWFFLYSLLLVLENFFHWYWTELTILDPCTCFLFSVLCTFFFTSTLECLYFLVIAARPPVLFLLIIKVSYIRMCSRLNEESQSPRGGLPVCIFTKQGWTTCLPTPKTAKLCVLIYFMVSAQFFLVHISDWSLPSHSPTWHFP